MTDKICFIIQIIEGNMPKYNYTNDSLMRITIKNVTSGSLIFSNGTSDFYTKATFSASNDSLNRIIEHLNSNTTDSDGQEAHWPSWIEPVMCISHLCLAFNCSVNFFIYYFKRRGFKLLNRGTFHDGSKVIDIIVLKFKINLM